MAASPSSRETGAPGPYGKLVDDVATRSKWAPAWCAPIPLFLLLAHFYCCKCIWSSFAFTGEHLMELFQQSPLPNTWWVLGYTYTVRLLAMTSDLPTEGTLDDLSSLCLLLIHTCPGGRGRFRAAGMKQSTKLVSGRYIASPSSIFLPLSLFLSYPHTHSLCTLL